MHFTLWLVLALALGYLALRLFRQKNVPDPTDRSRGFRPRIGFTRLDGMTSLSLLLANKSKKYVWVEEIEIFLSGLTADDQTAEPSCHEVHKIRQMVRSGDLLPISLAEVIYKAAGGPQRKYSCTLSSILRYRIDEEWAEKTMETHKVRMIGLTASSIHRVRQPIHTFQGQGLSQEKKAQDLAAIAEKVK
jgi:hypothetical protein